MYRAACLVLIVFASYLATVSLGQIVVEPVLNCTAAKVGYTYPLNDTPLYYYTCRDATTPLILPCENGKGYISNGTLEGCMSWYLWSCTFKGGPPACDASQQALRFPSINPVATYVCQGINNASILECPEGTAYVPDGPNIGCKPWSEWMTYCPY